MLVERPAVEGGRTLERYARWGGGKGIARKIEIAREAGIVGIAGIAGIVRIEIALDARFANIAV